MPYDPAISDELRAKVQEKIRDINRAEASKVLFIMDRTPKPPDQVGVLPGSFNPLTLSHIELARRAKETFHLDEVVLSISKVTTDKEALVKPSLEERLCMLALGSREFGYSVALSSRGLFFEQAAALRGFYGPRTRIFFLIGSDKLFQILDPKYYGDRTVSLDLLFSLARLIVANRNEDSPDRMKAFLDAPENRRYARSIDLITLPSRFPLISSTLVRDKVRKGESIDGLVPEVIQRWVMKRGLYQSTGV